MIYWTLSSAPPESEGSLPEYLSPEEQDILAGKRFPKRRSEWLHGRLAAKKLLVQRHPLCSGLPLAEVLIANEPGGAPYATFADGSRLPGCLSITHTGSQAAAALSLQPHLQVGIDMETVEPRSFATFESYFTPTEAAYIQAGESVESADRLALIWSAKESVSKAMRIGLAADVLRIEITMVGRASSNLSGEDWSRFEVAVDPTVTKLAKSMDKGEIAWEGWWKFCSGTVVTLAALWLDQALNQRMGGNVPLQVS